MNKLLAIPHNDEAERLILGAIMTSVNAANHCLTELMPTDFYISNHLVLFQELKNMYKDGGTIDYHLVSIYLKKNDKVAACNGMHYILDLTFNTPSSLDYESICQDLLNLSKLRKVIHAAKDTLENAAKSSADAEEIISDSHKKLFEIQGLKSLSTKVPKTILESFSEHGNISVTYNWMKDRVSRGLPPYLGVPSYYPELDATLGFFRKGCIYYIGARTSMGKTTFMLNLISQLYTTGLNPSIGIFSLEMPAQMIIAKLACIMGDIFYSGFEDARLRPEQEERFIECAERLGRCNIFIEDEEDITISKLRARARRMVQNHKIEVIYIDYLTRIKPDTKNSNKHLQVDEISKGLQSMAKELNVPVICLAQLNRAVTTRTSQTPSLADFRESGSIEEDCDAAILLHRPEYYDPNQKPGKIHVIVAKNRLRGKLQTIEFRRSAYSERYFEEEPLMKQLEQANKESRNPFGERTQR